MHELSLAESLIDAVRQELRARPGATLRSVRVRVGALRLVVPETLEVCFAAATRDTPLAGATLAVEAVPATAVCGACGRRFEVAEQWFECPGCGTCGAALQTGRELELTSIELEEPEPAWSGEER